MDWLGASSFSWSTSSLAHRVTGSHPNSFSLVLRSCYLFKVYTVSIRAPYTLYKSCRSKRGQQLLRGGMIYFIQMLNSRLPFFMRSFFILFDWTSKVKENVPYTASQSKEVAPLRSSAEKCRGATTYSG